MVRQHKKLVRKMKVLSVPIEFEVVVDNVDDVDFGPINIGDPIFDMFL